MNDLTIIIPTYGNVSTIQLKHNGDMAVASQEFKRKPHFPMRGILRVRYKLIKLKIKSR